MHGQHKDSVSSLNKTDVPVVNIAASNQKDINIKRHGISVDVHHKPQSSLMLVMTSQLLSGLTENSDGRCNLLGPSAITDCHPFSIFP